MVSELSTVATTSSVTERLFLACFQPHVLVC